MNPKLNRAVAELDAELLKQHGSNVELFDRLTQIQREAGIMHGDRPICPFLRPYFLPRSTYIQIQYAAEVLSSAFENVCSAALEDDAVADHLGMTEKELVWARVDPGYRGTCVNSRLDTFLGPDGFAFLEYNAENPAGIGDQQSLESLFREVPEVRDFLDQNRHEFPQPHKRLLTTLVDTYRETGGEREKPSIGIVDWKGVDTGAEFEILREFFESHGHSCGIFDPYELEYRDGALMAGDFRIDIFYKRVIIHEFLERFDETHPLFEASSQGAVCLANSFRSKIPHKKSSFAILSDPRFRDLFSSQQREVIGRHIPWTRVVTDAMAEHRGRDVELLAFVRENRHKLVLKPNDDYGGHGIYIGWECSESEWDAAISTAMNAKYIVQERVAVEKTLIPTVIDGQAVMQELNVDFDPFLFKGKVEGGMVRLSSQSLVNITQGGGETALAILDDH